jgi:hypothetical protein
MFHPSPAVGGPGHARRVSFVTPTDVTLIGIGM